jgi:hypothetical protein
VKAHISVFSEPFALRRGYILHFKPSAETKSAEKISLRLSDD